MTWCSLDVLSAGLDSGLAIGIIVIFFTVYYPKNGTIGLHSIQSWWGNTVSFNTADASKLPMRVLADGEIFGCVALFRRFLSPH